MLNQACQATVILSLETGFARALSRQRDFDEQLRLHSMEIFDNAMRKPENREESCGLQKQDMYSPASFSHR